MSANPQTTHSGAASRVAERNARLFASVLSIALVAMAVVLPSPDDQVHSSTPPKYVGVNIASAGFAPKRLPGVHGKDYIYPTRSTAEPFRALGMNTVRLPVLWERLQPKAMGPLDPAESSRLDRSLADLADFRMVIIDVHNYARYYSVALDQPGRSGAMLADLWSRLAERYKDSPHIAFGIMNEPHDIDPAVWRAIADETVAAIRKTGAKNLVLVPGTRWSGGHSWFEGGRGSNAATMAGFSDPGQNFVFEIHQYLDANSSGTNYDCVSKEIGRQRLALVTRWLREQRAQAILGEFGAASSPLCLAALNDLLHFLNANGDVWIGWTYWAGGEWWGDYPFSIQPAGGRSKPQAAILQRHISDSRGAIAK